VRPLVPNRLLTRLIVAAPAATAGTRPVIRPTTNATAATKAITVAFIRTSAEFGRFASPLAMSSWRIAAPTAMLAAPPIAAGTIASMTSCRAT
jgi:hypothetical protein